MSSRIAMIVVAALAAAATVGTAPAATLTPKINAVADPSLLIDPNVKTVDNPDLRPGGLIPPDQQKCVVDPNNTNPKCVEIKTR